MDKAISDGTWLGDRDSWSDILEDIEIGRASCRERV